jgi:hypothetical protein
MKKTFQTAALLLGAWTLALTAQAQQNSQPSADFAVTYNPERAKVASADCGCFWMQGGSFDAGVPLYRGLGVAASVSGETSANITPGVDLSLVTFVFGPRYTLRASRWLSHVPGLRRGTSLFGEGLFGSAHGFNGVFSTSSGFKGSANALSMQFGGGLNIGIAKGFGVRAVEVDYVRSRFRDFGDNSQNDLRLGIGVTYHWGEH